MFLKEQDSKYFMLFKYDGLSLRLKFIGQMQLWTQQK